AGRRPRRPRGGVRRVAPDAGPEVRRRLRPLPRSRAVAAAGTLRPLLTRAVLVALLLGALAFPAVFTLPFPRHIMIMIFLYGALATAWNIIAGYCGQISLGQAVFFGVGAYTSSLLFRDTGLTPWAGMIAGVAFAVAVSQIVGYP